MLRPTLAVLTSILLLPFASTIARADGVDVSSYAIDVTIHPERITETVRIVATSEKPARELTLKLASSMNVVTCRLGEVDVPVRRDGADLVLDLRKAGAPKGELALDFELEGKPHNFQRRRFLRTVISPEHAYIRSQYAWYPRLDDDLALYETTVRARQDWTVRTAGDLASAEEEGDQRVWHFVLTKPTREIGFAAGDYRTVEREGAGGIRLDALVFPGHEAGGERLLETVAKSVEFYAAWFGGIEEKRFSLVEMPPAFGEYSGYGMTGYCLVGSGSFEKDGGESLVGHEVSHTWWGREVGFSNFASEMLATYCTMRYLEEHEGEEAARAERLRFRTRVRKVVTETGGVSLDSIQGFGSGMDPAVYAPHAYDKAAMLLHALEREMGRKAFDAALKALFEAHRGEVIDYAVVAKELAGKRYKWLFEQWGSPALPTLSLNHSVKASRGKFKVSGAVLQEGVRKAFRMHLQLRAVRGEETFDQDLELKKAKTSFKFTCPFEPEKLLLDPDGHTLFLTDAVDAEALAKRAFGVVSNPGMGEERTLLRAIADFERLIEAVEEQKEEGRDTSAKLSECHAAIGRCLFRLGRVDEAKEKLELAIGMRDSGPFWRQWIHLRLGNIADLQGRRAEALEHYDAVLSITRNGSKHAARLAGRFKERAYEGYEEDG